jgi:hypothetical protein
MSTAELHQLIKELNRADLESADFDYLVRRLRKASQDTTIPLRSRVQLFYRARISNSDKIVLVCDLGAPPKEKVTGFQRCNPPGVPMFYGASTPLTALLEVDAQVGDIVFLSQWIPKWNPLINHVFDQGEFATRRNSTQKEILFHSYLDTIFTRPISALFSNQYKLTAAVATVLTTNIELNSEDSGRSDGTVGIRYPSIAHSYRGWNTAFHAAFSVEQLELVHTTQLRVLSRAYENLQISVIDNALEHMDGSLVWTGDPASIPLPNKEPQGIKFISNGRSWVLPVYEQMPGDEELSVFLRG